MCSHGREDHFARVFSAKWAQEGFNRRSLLLLFCPSARSTSPYLTRTVHSTGQPRRWRGGDPLVEDVSL